MIKSSAPGKLILFGEHAVVYGETAVATAIDKRAYVTACELNEKKIIVESKNLNTSVEETLKSKTHNLIVRAVQVALEKLDKQSGVGVEINSKIPVGVGLGSSASVVTATASSVLNLFSDEVSAMDVAEVAYEAEKIAHGKPSGIDTAITTYGKTISFKSGEVEQFDFDDDNFSFVIGNTGIRKSTKEMVENVKSIVEDPRVSYNLFTIGAISKRAKDVLLRGDFHELGKMMSKNHEYLKALGVSSPDLEHLVKAALDAGSYGAKLTGAGGGGCMVALTDSPKEVAGALKEAGAVNTYEIKINQDGVIVEE